MGNAGLAAKITVIALILGLCLLFLLSHNDYGLGLAAGSLLAILLQAARTIMPVDGLRESTRDQGTVLALVFMAAGVFLLVGAVYFAGENDAVLGGFSAFSVALLSAGARKIFA